MQVKKVFPSKFTQTTGGNYAKWNNLNNLTNDEFSKYAQTDLIRGYTLSPNTPAKLTLTNFKCELPAGARVKQIRTKHNLNKAHYQNYSKCCDLGNVKVSIAGLPSQRESVNVGFNYNSNMRTHYWDCDFDASVVNSSDFGMIMDFPKNKNNIRGYGRLRNAYLEIYYELPDYEVSLNNVKGKYKDDTFEVTAIISNKTDTTHKPTLQLTIPSGFVLENYTTKGNLSQSDNTLTWVPDINRVSSDTLTLRLSTDITWATGQDSYTGTWTIVEDYQGTSKTLNTTVQRYLPYTPTVETYDDDKTIVNEEYTHTFVFTDDDVAILQSDSPSGYIGFLYMDINGDTQTVLIPEEEWPSDNTITVTMTPTNLGLRSMQVTRYTDTTYDHYLYLTQIQVVPNDEDSRLIGAGLLLISGEELNRLGNGHVYTAQTWMFIPGGEPIVRDWKYNFRLGVFNDAIPDNVTNYEYTDENGEIREVVVDTTDYDNLDIDDIIDQTIWSEPATDPAGYNNMTVTFRYNDDYPLYIILTSDNRLFQYTLKIPKFTEPVISETQFYIGPEPNGIFPMPILNTLTEDTTSTETIEKLHTNNTIVFSDFDIDYTFGEDTIVRGAEVTGNVDGNNIALTSRLYNEQNETKVKSTIIDEDTNTFSLGGYGDLWGFKTEQIKNFTDWEAHLTLSNPYEQDIEAELNNIRLTLYVDTLENSTIKTYIDGEDLDYYGCFLTDLKIPEGLKTDTDYLHVNGTDYNNPYMQTIKEKELEAEFDIGEACDIYGTTVALRQFTKLLVNERDKYNKPIPKRIEFSHYPDVYWEYIMEDGYTPDIDMSTYHVKVKLTVPQGTSFSKQDIVTTGQGYVDGLTHIHPVIQIKPVTSTISIRETYTGQVFNIGYTDFSGKTMTIDCRNRKVTLNNEDDDETIDISQHVEMNSDWFRLLGYFNFNGTGCIIQSITYKERW